MAVDILPYGMLDGWSVGVGEVEHYELQAAPGGDTRSDNAVIGSTVVDSVSGIVYKKHTAGAGAGNWSKYMTEADVIAITGGDSVYDPATLADTTTYATVTAAETAANIGDSLDGVTISSGSTVLLTDLTVGVDGVYDVTGVSGNWSFALATDNNPNPEPGDTVQIISGTDAGNVFFFNDSNTWIVVPLSIAGIVSEAAFHRLYTGKPSIGAVLPLYTEENQIADGDTLTLATDKLDIKIGANPADDAILTGTDAIGVQLAALSAAVIAGTGVTGTEDGVTSAVINSFLADEFQTVKYSVNVQEDGTQNTSTFELTVMHNGHASADATGNPRIIRGAFGKIGSKITGLDVDVVMTGVGAAQSLAVTITSTPSVNIRWSRISATPAF